jgi:hypothetical protein
MCTAAKIEMKAKRKRVPDVEADVPLSGTDEVKKAWLKLLCLSTDDVSSLTVACAS